MSAVTYGEDELRERAVLRLKKRAQFRSHAITYVLVNLWHVVIWAVIWATTGYGFFWPIFPAAVWGVFLALNWWDVYRRKDKPPKAERPTEAQVCQEIDALRLEARHAT
jgi:2TM domain